MRRQALLLIGLLLTALAVSVLWYDRVHAPVLTLPTDTVTLRGPDGQTVQVFVEVADDAAEQERGLMDREHLPNGHGMIFVFDEPRELRFWMKNTLLPLDILYFDADADFVSRTTMSPCLADPCPLYPSNGLARFALEVNAGEPLTVPIGMGWVLSL